ncbi:DUF2798 domain-containing protein [Acinetobacter rudis]|uniref:DUF2798 domain-containing protein n=1 Tax=Acinetobacter rudis TaxID=632955 RepID=UPI0035BE6273
MNNILNDWKLPSRALIFLVPLFLTFIMSGVISFVSTLQSLSLIHWELSHWIKSWFYSWVIAFPTAFFVLPLAKRFAMLFIKTS